MNTALRYFIIGLAWLTVMASAQADIDFPEKLGPYTRGDKNTYEQPGLGYSYPYRGKDGWATVYVFDMGLADIPDGIDSDIIRRSVQDAVDSVKIYEERGHYANVQIVPLSGDFDILKDSFLMKKMEYQIVKEDGERQDVVSYIFCRGQDGEILKVRMTGDRNANLAPDLLKFMMALRVETT